MIEMDYPSVLLISEEKYREFMNGVLEGNQEEINGTAPSLSDIKQVNLLISSKIPKGTSFVRTSRRWVRISPPDLTLVEDLEVSGEHPASETVPAEKKEE